MNTLSRKKIYKSKCKITQTKNLNFLHSMLFKLNHRKKKKIKKLRSRLSAEKTFAVKLMEFFFCVCFWNFGMKNKL